MDKMKLLIVDDEPLTVEMLSIFMQINGHDCISAYNGSDGLLMAQTQQPDVMILDLMMPDMEGWQVCQTLRATPDHAKTPVVILSARTDSEAIEQAYAAGANIYLTKPPDLIQLLGEIERLHAGA
jgi:DNA-binding response OmpR family regulator